MVESDRRRALLVAALGFLQVRDQSIKMATLRRWLDSWAGTGAILTGMTRQGFDVDLMSIGPERWQATVLEANPVGGSPLVAGHAEEASPARAVHRAAWAALTQRTR